MSSDEEHQVPLPEDVASGDDADTERETEILQMRRIGNAMMMIMSQ